jgi:hypothetical protein
MKFDIMFDTAINPPSRDDHQLYNHTVIPSLTSRSHRLRWDFRTAGIGHVVIDSASSSESLLVVRGMLSHWDQLNS